MSNIKFTHKLWLIAQTTCSIVLALLFMISSTLAISQADLEFFAANGIYYYDPSGSNVNCVTNATGGGITIIGDSITESAKSKISSLLPRTSIYAQTSKRFGNESDPATNPDDTSTNPSGISIAKYLLDNGSLGSTVVFALGTNNFSPALQQSQINALLSLLGSNRNIYFITNYDSLDMARYTSNNNLFNTAASNNPNVHVIDWATEVSANPSSYVSSSDGIHPIAAGQQLFAELINRALSSYTSGQSSGSFTNYAGVKVFSTAQEAALQANQPFYENASNMVLAEYNYNLPWQILAVLHYKEHGLQRDNPSNGQGAYQLFSYTGGGNNANAFRPSGPLSDTEFQAQTDLVARLIASKVDGYGGYGIGLDLTNPNDVKRFFFGYNGKATQYYNRAIAMGFSEEEAQNGEGSTYVMNRYDAPRDPANVATMSPLWKGRFTGDGQWNSESTSDQTFGAFVVYEALGGGGGGYCSSGGLVSGGMTYEEAYAFVENYVNNPSECTEWSSICSMCDVYGANCVTFSQYFINKFTTAGLIGHMGHGGDVVNNLINNYGFVDGGTIPRPYAIFSTRSDAWSSMTCNINGVTVKCGHTGVVLGIDESKDEIYFGQMSCGSQLSWGLTRIKYKLSDYTNGEFTYAYTDGILKK